MQDVTAAAAARLWQAVRQAGVLGMPRLRVRSSGEPGRFQLVVEDQREPGDEVVEFRGIRFYLDAQTVQDIGRVELDLRDGEFVLCPVDESS